MAKALIFNIQRFSVQDGPGIRATVFLKGCPLHCPWCSNPESQNRWVEVMHRNSLCNNCGACIDTCDLKALSINAPGEKGMRIDRKRCNNCGKCVEACVEGALTSCGREISDEEVFSLVQKDQLYYRNSGGGVTCSGGEALEQAEFVSALFKRCREGGLHTTLDTCGAAPAAALDKVLPYTDLVLFDLKLMAPHAHRQILKASNGVILRNARIIAAKQIPMWIRVPLIPGITDTDENLRTVASFVKQLDGNITRVDLLPYHRLGVGKYQMLDREYQLLDLDPYSQIELQRIRDRMLSWGVTCDICG